MLLLLAVAQANEGSTPSTDSNMIDVALFSYDVSFPNSHIFITELDNK